MSGAPRGRTLRRGALEPAGGGRVSPPRPVSPPPPRLPPPPRGGGGPAVGGGGGGTPAGISGRFPHPRARYLASALLLPPFGDPPVWSRVPACSSRAPGVPHRPRPRCRLFLPRPPPQSPPPPCAVGGVRTAGRLGGGERGRGGLRPRRLPGAAPGRDGHGPRAPGPRVLGRRAGRGFKDSGGPMRPGGQPGALPEGRGVGARGRRAPPCQPACPALAPRAAGTERGYPAPSLRGLVSAERRRAVGLAPACLERVTPGASACSLPGRRAPTHRGWCGRRASAHPGSRLGRCCQPPAVAAGGALPQHSAIRRACLALPDPASLGGGRAAGGRRGRPPPGLRVEAGRAGAVPRLSRPARLPGAGRLSAGGQGERVVSSGRRECARGRRLGHGGAGGGRRGKRGAWERGAGGPRGRAGRAAAGGGRAPLPAVRGDPPVLEAGGRGWRVGSLRGRAEPSAWAGLEARKGLSQVGSEGSPPFSFGFALSPPTNLCACTVGEASPALPAVPRSAAGGGARREAEGRGPSGAAKAAWSPRACGGDRNRDNS